MQALLFDIDETLVDSSEGVERVWRQVAREFGGDEEGILRVCHGRRDVDLVGDFFAPEVTEAVLARISQLDAEKAADVPPVPGARQVLARLDDGQWAAVTSGPRPLMTARLRAAGLPVPTVLITAEDVRNGKPDPEGFLLAAQALGVAPTRCVVVEDSPAGVAAGKAAGSPVVAVTTTHSAGLLAGADLVVGSLSELPTWLAGFLGPIGS